MKKILTSDIWQLLGGFSPEQFVQRYWHKRPLLVRRAIPAMKPLLSRAQLFELACQDEVESRIVTRSGREWSLQSGPFERRDFKRDAAERWSLLVQGVNLHDDAADALLRRFSFIPQARLDDLMISWANDGGGVGPHLDSYDVFLLQAQGTRRWRISERPDTTLNPRAPLKILKHFKHEEEYLLEPGDMLYLPPGVAHEGVAVGECMTYSIGFRAPSALELKRGYLEHLAETAQAQGFYADRDLALSKRSAELDDAYIARAARLIGSLKANAASLETFLGQHLTEPKAQVFFDAPDAPMTASAFKRAAQKHGVKLDRRTQFLTRRQRGFINGEAISLPADAGLRTLADARQLSAAQITALSSPAWAFLHDWYACGYLHLISA
jgi:50S ribosomal protein L16 3-hydroxylase